jgi:hypothetical protein
MAEDLQAEVERLRAEVESHRQRELAELKSALAIAREEAANYRQEAYRNAETGRQIAIGYQQQIADLTTKLQQLRNTDSAARRNGA